jgi:uncharacterized protein YkwD
MKFARLSIIVLFMVSMSFISCSKESTDIDTVYKKDVHNLNADYSDIELNIMELVNEYRDSLGLSKLNKIDYISNLAFEHSTYMANSGQPSHDNYPNRVKKLIETQSANEIGENVAFGYNSGKAVFLAWLRSEEHRAVIESSEFTHFGIGVAQGLSNKNYFTNIFISK